MTLLYLHSVLIPVFPRICFLRSCLHESPSQTALLHMNPNSSLTSLLAVEQIEPFLQSSHDLDLQLSPTGHLASRASISVHCPHSRACHPSPLTHLCPLLLNSAWVGQSHLVTFLCRPDVVRTKVSGGDRADWITWGGEQGFQD